MSITPRVSGPTPQRIPPGPSLPYHDPLLGALWLQGLTLSDQVGISWETARDPARVMAATLARCVVLEDRLPLFTVDEWDLWGARHADTCATLYEEIRKVSGSDEDDLKN